MGSKNDLIEGPTFKRVRSWYTGIKPYTLPQAYDLSLERVSRTPDNTSLYAGYSPVWSYALFQDTSSQGGIALDMARAKFVRKATNSAQAQLATMAGEWKESLTLIRKSSLALVAACRSAKRGNWKGVGLALGIDPLSFGVNRKKAAKETANRHLSFTFGVMPLMEDIVNASKVFGRDFGHYRIVGRGGAFLNVKNAPPSGYGYLDYSGQVFFRAEVGAFVWISNPNVFLANQLGLINPLVVAYELTPWSFVLDWVVGVSSYLKSLTEFMGMEIQKPWTTQTRVANCSAIRMRRSETWQPWEKLGNRHNFEAFGLRRRLGIPAYGLPKLRPLGVYPGRVASAISLAVQRAR